MRSQIGALTTLSVTTMSPSLALPARDIQRGSLVVIVFVYDGGSTDVTSVTDTAAGSWKFINRGGGGGSNPVTAAVAWSWNHPGGSSVAITIQLAESKGYRYAVAIELSGPDLVDPFFNFAMSVGPYANTPAWIQAPAGSDAFSACGTYNNISSASYSAEAVMLSQGTYSVFAWQPLPGGTNQHSVVVTPDSGNSTIQLIAAFRPPLRPLRNWLEWPGVQVVSKAFRRAFPRPILNF